MTSACIGEQVGNVECVGEDHIRFDFLGKDSMRYENEVAVHPTVFSLMQAFCKGAAPCCEVALMGSSAWQWVPAARCRARGHQT